MSPLILKTPTSHRLPFRPGLSRSAEAVDTIHRCRREGELVAVVLDAYRADFALDILHRFNASKRPLTQEALDRWIDDVLGGMKMSELLPPAGEW